jgi:hypothetical protein
MNAPFGNTMNEVNMIRDQLINSMQKVEESMVKLNTSRESLIENSSKIPQEKEKQERELWEELFSIIIQNFEK